MSRGQHGGWVWLGVALPAMSLCTGCAYQSRVWQYPRPIPEGRLLLDLLDAQQRSYNGGPPVEWPETLTPDHWVLINGGRMSGGVTEVPVPAIGEYRDIPVYWSDGDKLVPPRATRPPREFVILGRVIVAVGFFWQGGDWGIIDTGFRRAANALGGDAVVDANRGIFLATYPGNEFRGYVIRWCDRGDQAGSEAMPATQKPQPIKQP